ncbi:hypothetical protein HJC23_011332 [Cyclotella cryptica]|uniref:Uncharacterized protein n=1 Tax=Cyclotella cryptica TaxID=29204 RepID=A0ABD3QWT2_9STRA|eukprot:CCRYP_001746-RA/>CCRYP_001746-RA protein AED:0.00 eAED:0.00 QI:264/-1/1/1/-1/1/1/116/380
MNASTKLRVLLGLLLLLPTTGFLTSPHRSCTTPPDRLHLAQDSDQATARRASSSRPRRPPPSTRSRDRSSSTREVEKRRAPHQFDHTKEEARPFLDDPVAIVQSQSANEDAPSYVFSGDEVENLQLTVVADESHLIHMSLDELFPNLQFSEKFNADGEFRDSLRSAMREDIFDSTPAYMGMSEKARRMLLLPDSSLQGSWNCKQFVEMAATANGDREENSSQPQLRMRKLTNVLKSSLGESAPTGDEFMEKIGSLCGSKPSTHWIDIVGIVDRRIPHSWHQDTGRSPNGDTFTVLLGFPKEDNYDGVGVFSHAVKLKYERVAKDDHPINEPVVYPGLQIDEEYIVRPKFAKGKEILLFRDIDVIHSSPDVAFRSSVMRFM